MRRWRAARAWLADPATLLYLHAILTDCWIGFLAVSMFAGWMTSVVLVSTISFYTVIAQHMTLRRTARLELRQREREEDDGAIARWPITGSTTCRCRTLRGRF
ncbi:MAG TPA: hypothetical protein VF024_19295 [Solirubrobacteraceae bacterium]